VWRVNARAANPVAYLADMIARAPPPRMRIAMVWAYFDETVVHQKVDGLDGAPPQYLPTNLLIGGCVSSREKWEELESKWSEALREEKVEWFHAKDFYAFQRQFEWYTPDQKKDFSRHEAFRDRLADIITEYVEEAVAFTSAVSVESTERSAIKRAYRDGALRAFNALSRETLRPSGGAHVILARHPDMPPWLLLQYFANFNWDNSLKGCGIFDPREVIPLQAADFVCHSINRAWNGLQTKSMDRLADGFRQRGKQFRTELGSSWTPPEEIFEGGPLG
jgi:hypothetical protein